MLCQPFLLRAKTFPRNHCGSNSRTDNWGPKPPLIVIGAKLECKSFLKIFLCLFRTCPPAGGSGWLARFSSALSQFVYSQSRARKQADPERQVATKAELRAPSRSRMDSPATPCTETMKLPSGHALIYLPSVALSYRLQRENLWIVERQECLSYKSAKRGQRFSRIHIHTIVQGEWGGLDPEGLEMAVPPHFFSGHAVGE